MEKKLLEILACTKCKGQLEVSTDAWPILESELTCSQCNAVFPITNGIPRFVEPDNYASSFGYQWNLFRKEQIDTYNGTSLSADRLWSETAWDKEDLKDKWVLDAGCGAGRFLDAASKSEGQIVGIDISSAIDAAQENLSGRGNVHFVQASIYELPFRDGMFDFCYCIGVIQHTPDREKSLISIANMVKPDGKLAVTIYPRKIYTKLFSKYWVRPLTKRMKKESLLKVITTIMPVAFPVTDLLFRVPILGKGFMFLIPVANYVHEKQLTRKQRYDWAILDTFDMLSPHYDEPMTHDEATEILTEANIKDISRPTTSGLNLAGIRKS